MHRRVQQRRQHQRKDELRRHLDVRHERQQRQDTAQQRHQYGRGHADPVPERDGQYGTEQQGEEQSELVHAYELSARTRSSPR